MMGSMVADLRKKSDEAWTELTRQLQGMEPYMERSDAPDEWTTRQVLAHLLFEDGWKPVPVLESFATHDLPVIEIKPGLAEVTPARRRMTLKDFIHALDTQRREVFDYLARLQAADFQRKARIPLFKQFMGTDEIAIDVYVGAMFAYHWSDHAGQFAKIRKTVGLLEAT